MLSGQLSNADKLNRLQKRELSTEASPVSVKGTNMIATHDTQQRPAIFCMLSTLTYPFLC